MKSLNLKNGWAETMMVKIDRENKNLTTLDAPSLADASIS